MKKPKMATGETKGSYLPSADLKGLGSSPAKKSAIPKKKSSLATAMAKIKIH